MFPTMMTKCDREKEYSGNAKLQMIAHQERFHIDYIK